MNPEARLEALHIRLLHTPVKPIGSYVRQTNFRRLYFFAGHGPRNQDGSLIRGKVGHNLSLEQAQEAARGAAVSLLTTIRNELGSLNRVRQLIRCSCFINCTPDFVDHAKVANGCSDLLVDVFGNAGRHSRSAIGVSSLPNGIPFEVEATLQASLGLKYYLMPWTIR